MAKEPKKTVHAHWLWFKVDGLDKVSSAIAMCEKEKLNPQTGEITADLKLVNCEKCLERVERTIARRQAPKVTPAAVAKKKLEVAIDAAHTENVWGWPAGARIHMLTKQNPCKPGSAKAKRWAVVFAHKGKTWEEYRDAKGNPETLRNIIRAKVAEVRGEEK